MLNSGYEGSDSPSTAYKKDQSPEKAISSPFSRKSYEGLSGADRKNSDMRQPKEGLGLKETTNALNHPAGDKADHQDTSLASKIRGRSIERTNSQQLLDEKTDRDESSKNRRSSSRCQISQQPEELLRDKNMSEGHSKQTDEASLNNESGELGFHKFCRMRWLQFI